MLKFIRYYGLVLSIFAIITTGLTSLVYNFTKNKINNQIFIKQQKIFNQIIPHNFYNNNLIKECYLIKNNKKLNNKLPCHLYIARKNGKLIAGIIEDITFNGYSGLIKLLIAADFHGKIIGVRVIEHHETPGLGDKIDIRISNWINYFLGKKVDLAHISNWAVKKDGGNFDSFTGATITPRAVINAIKNAVLFIQSVPKEILSHTLYLE